MKIAGKCFAQRRGGPELLITVGVSEALLLALMAILDPGDEVIVPEPCFVAYAPTVVLRGLDAVDAAHLAGFLDGDGSIIFQFVRQDGYRFGFYIRSTLQLSQSTSARQGLEQLRSILGGGYIRDRGRGR